ncbi:hypothetical protein BBJ28_00002820, partial [Nothophytophthora sp. Chile5]
MARKGGTRIPIGVSAVIAPPKSEAGGGDALLEQFTREFTAVLQLAREKQAKELAATTFGCDKGDVANAPQEVAFFGSIAQKLVPLVDRLVHAPPEHLSVAKKTELLLLMGDKFFQAQEFRAASVFFYEKALEEDASVDSQGEPTPHATPHSACDRILAAASASTTSRSSTEGQAYVRALFGVAMCCFHVQKRLDGCIRHPGTLEKMVEALRLLQTGMEAAVALEPEYTNQFSWLILNGSLLTFSIAKPLQTMGFSREVVIYLKWCLLAM